jgi:hypothetical protein
MRPSHFPSAAGYPWDGRFKTKEEVVDYFAGDKIICLLCGRELRCLGRHLRARHGVVVEDYCVRFGLPLERGLTCEPSHQAWVQANSSPERIALLNRVRSMGAPRWRRSPLAYFKPHNNLISGGYLGRGSLPRINKTAACAEILKRIGDGRTLTEVCRDPDIPSRRWLHEQLRVDAAFKSEVEAIFEALPFSVQARANRLGKRFEGELRALFDCKTTDKDAARILGVTLSACHQRTKKWRQEKTWRRHRRSALDFSRAPPPG